MDGSASGVTNKQIFNFIKENLDFNQLINEFDYSWVHVSYNPNGKQRKQVLNAVKKGGKTYYVPYT
jgi:adenine-specific DNA methylase